MFRVRQYRAFLAGGYAWTIHVECEGAQLDARGELLGVEWREFWQWITDRITPVGDRDGVELTPREHSVQDIGDAIDRDPWNFTAERVAAVCLGEWRAKCDAVVSVTVLRTFLAGMTDTVECTVRTQETEGITKRELVAILRRFAEINHLHTHRLDVGPTDGR